MPTTQPYHSGQIYDPNVPTLINEQLKYLDVLYDPNDPPVGDAETAGTAQANDGRDRRA